METSSSSVERVLSAEGFERLCRAMEQFAQTLAVDDPQAIWFSAAFAPFWQTGTEQTGTEQTGTEQTGTEQMADQSGQLGLVRAAGFSALAIGEAVSAGYRTRLLFEASAMQDWSQKLGHPRLIELTQDLLPNHPDLQSQFTLKLVDCLSMPTHCELTEAALRLQLEQERLLNQVTSQIRRSLDLPSILKTAVEQVRQFLQADRLVIYQLKAPTALPLEFFQRTKPKFDLDAGQMATQYGSVIYEARSAESVPTVMHLSDAHCFVEHLRDQDWQGLEDTLAIDDVEIRYSKVPCLLEFLRRAQVRAKLVAPIRLQDQLWGLLIAHECSRPRHWQENERRLLQQIAQTLAIAISQAQLYAEVQQQKQTLEERVIERTQDLRDALLTAQAANRAKSEFLAIVSHELRTPLACIIGMSATLQRWSKEALTERQQNFLQTIHESGEHLLALINDILDLSQAEAGRMVLNVQRFSLSSLAQQTLKAFEGQAALQEVELELDLHRTALQDSFSGDPRRVRQILFNLLSNAVKFTPAGGKVSLRVLTQPDLAILQVQDTGIGIPDQQMPLLFQKFQQLDSSYRREYQGTGLGLALTKQLVELHGGWIEVESTVGVGSVFTVKLPPQALAPQTQTPARAELPVAQPRQRIVLIEPNEESASLICDLLLAADYQVVWVLEGLAALSQIEVLLPKAVILNVGLPDLNAAHLIRSLRQNPATKQIKVLALVSASSQDSPTAIELQDPSLFGAVDGLLTLPFQPEALLQKLRAAL